jgi:formylglycine-generating enzyme required for sulfatase activity
LIVDAIVKNLGGAIWNLFTGKSISEILEEILNNAVTAVTKNFAPTDNSFSADLSGLENSLFTSYSMGKGMTSASDYRWITPAFLTGLTELILPGLEIAVDLGFTKITLKSKKDMEGMAKLTELLISKFSYDLTDIFLTASVEKDYFKASGKLIDFFIKIATEPEFYKWLSKYGPISGSKLGNMVANAITDVINKVYNPLAWIDTGIKLGNFLFSGVKIVEIVAVEDYKDQYFIKLPVCKPNCTNKECGDNGCGGSCGTCTGGKTCQSGKCVTGGCWPDCPEMVTVAAGKFWMGCNEAVDNECYDDEYPYHEVYLDAYEIDTTEVTVSAYGECVSGGGCTNPSTFSGYCNWEKSGKESHPVNCVDWYQSDKYCKWAGKRLCTEAEWEKAARGTDGRKFPWGNEPASCEYAVMDDGWDGCGTDSTMAVGSKPKGASPYGAMDMAGNVWEWVNDWYDSDYYSISPASNPKGPESGSTRVRRGGSFYGYGFYLRVSLRFNFVPSAGYVLLGFRCCRSK